MGASPRSTLERTGGAATAGNGGPVRPFEAALDPAPSGKIDELVFRRLRQAGIRPAALCSDEVFVRRAYLDVIGVLPTADEARQFLADRAPARRRELVEKLLQRDEFADYWAMKWCDLLRVKAEFPINLWPNAVQTYHHWIRTCVKTHVPYDRFVRELLTSSGSNFRVPPVNFYRAMQSRDPAGIARTVALTFMGERAEKWPKERLAGMAAFFSQIAYKHTGEWKEEIVLRDPSATSPPAHAVTPDGKPAHLAPGQDPREAFADWLIRPANPWFARNIVNRLWYWLLGRGIVHAPDDIRPDNPPSNPELLAYLQGRLVSARYDLIALYREILNSTTYQLSAIPRSTHRRADELFARYPLRRLDAEVLIDALDQITGGVESYSSSIPEPFTFIPENRRSISLADGSTTSPFLEMFGRPSRDTGLESERNNHSTAAQRLYLLNSSQVQRKLERSANLLALTRSGKSARDAIDAIYLTALSRYPTDEERKVAEAYVVSGRSVTRPGALDLTWALINSAEFLYRH